MEKSKHNKIKRGKAEAAAIWIVFAVFLIYAVTLVFPFVWMFINSFKTSQEFFQGNIWGLPETWRFENYSEIFFGKPAADEASTPIVTTVTGKLFGVTHKYSIFHMFIVSILLTPADHAFEYLFFRNERLRRIEIQVSRQTGHLQRGDISDDRSHCRHSARTVSPDVCFRAYG